jgi:hypothetical protein
MNATKSVGATKATTTEPEPASKEAEGRTPRRARRGLKRLSFQVPKAMPLPLKALWQSASPEQQAIAHRTATAILSTWLGKSTREAAAKELGLSAVRLWHLSQQAVAGLVVGCLRQPRYRGRPPAGGYGPREESVGALRQKIAVLERELDGAQRLIEVMKDLPGNRDRAGSAEGEAVDGGARRGRRRAAHAADAAAAGGPGTEASHGERT